LHPEFYHSTEIDQSYRDLPGSRIARLGAEIAVHSEISAVRLRCVGGRADYSKRRLPSAYGGQLVYVGTGTFGSPVVDQQGIVIVDFVDLEMKVIQIVDHYRLVW
jgi:hypothetical protein